MEENGKKKNILDLHYQKYLNIATTSVILIYTYLIGIGIAFLSKQISLDDIITMSAVFLISAGIIGACSIAFFHAVYHLKNIPEVIKNL